MALSDASREAVARAQFFQELNISSMPVLILSDSETALDLADGTTSNYSKSKHIDIKEGGSRSHRQRISNCGHLHQGPWTTKAQLPCPINGHAEFTRITIRGGFLMGMPLAI